MVHPALLLLGGIGAGVGTVKVIQVVTKPKKEDFQTQNVLGQGGIPLKIRTPISKKTTREQRSTRPVSPPAKGRYSVPQTSIKGPVVYAPPKSTNQYQSAPILVSPTGASSMAIGSVKDVQRGLNTLGFLPRLVEDGIIGPKTIANIKAFQSKNGLVVDGNAGPATKAAISSALTQLASGGGTTNAVKAVVAAATPVQVATASNMSSRDVQHHLNLLGANPRLVEDGIIGPKSVAAIKSFQLSHGLVADGVAGSATKTALAAAVAHPVTRTGIPAAAPLPVAPYSPPVLAPFVQPITAAAISGTRDVQHALNVLGIAIPPLIEDGALGPKTTAAIKAFQTRAGLAIDGLAGPITRAALTTALGASRVAVAPAIAPGAPYVPPEAAAYVAPVVSTVKSAIAATIPPASQMTNRDVQRALNVLGVASPLLVEDGVMGPKSIAAVKTFQANHALTPDGVAGPKTKAALDQAVHGGVGWGWDELGFPEASDFSPSNFGVSDFESFSEGSFGFGASSPDTMTIADIQRALNYLGAMLRVDGNIGPMTTQALKAFQQKHGLHPDGKAGPRTRRVLCKALQLATHCGTFGACLS